MAFSGSVLLTVLRSHMERFHTRFLCFDAFVICIHVRSARQFSFHVRMAFVYLKELKALGNLKSLLSKASTIGRWVRI